MDSIQGYVRMNWTVDAFFSNGGVDRFVNKLASVLNIAPSRIKIAGVRVGSAILDIYIDPLTPGATVGLGSIDVNTNQVEQ